MPGTLGPGMSIRLGPPAVGPSITPGEASSRGGPPSPAGLGSTSIFGFVSFGSLPSLIAVNILMAFHLENLIFFCVSSSRGSGHTLSNSKNEAAALNV